MPEDGEIHSCEWGCSGMMASHDDITRCVTLDGLSAGRGGDGWSRVRSEIGRAA